MVRRHRLRRRGGYNLPVISAAGFILVAMGAPIRSGETPGFVPRSTIAPEQSIQLALATVAADPTPLATAAPEPVRLALADPDLPPPVVIAMQAPAPELTAPDGVIAGSHPPVEVWQPAVVTQADPVPAAASVAERAEPSPFSRAVASTASVVPAADREVRAAPHHHAAPKPPTSALSGAVLGKWVPDADACNNPETEYLPLRISQGQASAGEGSCKFTSRKREGQTWTLTAECRDGDASWTSTVSLAVSRNELTWSSERGTATYVRCEPLVRVARAPVRDRQQVAAQAGPAKSKVAAAPAKKVAKVAKKREPALRISTDAGVPNSWATLNKR